MATFSPPPITLFFCVDIPELLPLYKQAIERHNHSHLFETCPNAGFDLYFPKGETLGVTNGINSYFFNLGVRAFMVRSNRKEDTEDHISFYMYPRSSLAGTPLMMSNHTGIIDSGFRGQLVAAVRNLAFAHADCVIEKHVRLFQICAPHLDRFVVKLLKPEDFDEFTKTERGEGGFGSTGV